MAPYQAQSNTHTQILSEKCLKYKKKLMKTKRKERPVGLVPYLNHDIMCQIFNRVPAISLFHNCRFVSKQSFNSITNPNFLKAHFLQSKPGVLLIEKLEEKGKKIVEVMKFMEINESIFGNVHHLHTLKENERFFSAKGAAGLCIIRDKNSINSHVMNPVTKESIQLPHLADSDLWHQIVFDRANMDCMLAVFSRKLTKITVERRCWSCMLTLYALDGSRRQIQGPDNSYLVTPVLINGVLYCNGEDEGLWCCDLSVGTFYLLKWPINRHKSNYFTISGDGGFLCCALAAHDWEVNIWILRQQKWVYRCFVEGKPGFDPTFIGCLGSEDLFLFTIDSSTLAAYHVKTKQWMISKLADNNRCGGIHVNSILPLTSKMLS